MDIDSNNQVTVIDAELIDSNNNLQTTSNTSVAPITLDPRINNDFDFARTNLYDLLMKGQGSLDELIDIAKASQHPRAYEVLATMLKNLGDINDKLLSLHHDYQMAKAVTATTNDFSTNTPLVGNAVFVGSSTDLLKLLKNNKKKNP